MITIDGSVGEGGGQILRTALALSMCTGLAFRIENIRANRDKPGLMRQHLTAVEAACAVSGAACDGAALGSTALTFRPGPVRAGYYRFAVGTAGSATLVLQTVLPALLTADGPSELHLVGGTHNPHAPPFEFLAHSFLPLIARMGPQVTAVLDRHGFYPAGGGHFRVTVTPAGGLRPLELVEPGPLQGVSAEALVAGLHPDIGRKELDAAMQVLLWAEECFTLRELGPELGPGNVLLLTARFANTVEVTTGFGELGVAARSVGFKAATRMAGFLESGVAVGPYLADQLLLPLALAGGGCFTTVKPSRHTLTNAETIGRFLDRSIRIAPREGGGHLVTVA